MKTTGQVIGVVVVIALFAAIVVGAIWAVSLVARIWPRLDATVATLALAAIGTTLVSARIFASGAVRAKQWEWRERTRLERISLYDRLLQAATEDEAYSTEDDRLALERRLLLVGAPAVLSVWRKRQSTGDSPAIRDVLLIEMIQAMRKDLGVRGAAAATSVLGTPDLSRSVRRTNSPQEHKAHHAR